MPCVCVCARDGSMRPSSSASGEFSAAADVYAEMGTLSDEADARLRSGRESEIRQALKFYRSVGATRYIEEGEALLAATA